MAEHGYEILGAVKVKDGLFIGDELSAQDLDFVVANKVTRVINCCGRQVPNHWEPIGVVYLTYCWDDADSQVILDSGDVVTEETFHFIEEALEGAESVLIHSVRGQSRSCCVLSAYMMKRYSWGLRKTMEFLSSRRPDLNLKQTFLQQLSGYERRLMASAKAPFTLDWSGADFSRLECEELLLRNTHLNSQMGPLVELHLPCGGAHASRLLWTDNGTDDPLRLEQPPGASQSHCKRDQAGQLMPTCLLKVRSAKAAAARAPDQRSLASRSTTPSSETLDGGAPRPPGFAEPSSKTFPTSSLVPTAWVEEPEAALEARHAPALSRDPRSGQAPPQGYRGPRDSLVGMSGGSSLDDRDQGGVARSTQRGLDPRDQGGPARAARRDSPGAARVARHDSPVNRGESPLRLLSRSGGQRAGVQGPRPGSSERASTPKGAPNPMGNLGLCLGSVRLGNPGGMTGAASGPGMPGAASGPGMPGAASGPGMPGAASGPGQGQGGYPVQRGPGPPVGGAMPQRPGMAAFRSGGPVRAKVDVFGDSSGAVRRPRPATAPLTRGGAGSRPASPVTVGRPQSRPASPQTSRPASPQRPLVPSYPGTSYGIANTGKQKGVLRRGPSPTPAFNRNMSPGKPRWRG